MTKNKKNANKTRSSLTKRNMKFLSWNIQAPSTTDGNKFGIKEFKNVINNTTLPACRRLERRSIYLATKLSVVSEKEAGPVELQLWLRKNSLKALSLLKIFNGLTT